MLTFEEVEMTDGDWGLHPEAVALVNDALARAAQASRTVSALAEQLPELTSAPLSDWLDSVAGPVPDADLDEAGFVPGRDGRWRHQAAVVPDVIQAASPGIALAVEEAHRLQGKVLGMRAGAAQSVSGGLCAELDGPAVVATARWSRQDSSAGGDRTDALAWAARVWAGRDVDGWHPDALDATRALARTLADRVGPELAAGAVLAVERRRWMDRNRAARLQFGRQDALGLGWANQDHHTFRSSRRSFGGLLKILEALGFDRRERFSAGAEAGWGAQVLEHPGTGAVVFADVDLTPEESVGDFSGDLADTPALGTVGAWCALHGESIFDAGLHHLAARYDFDRLQRDLGVLGVGFRPPFSELPHLRQAFTEAEVWPVAPGRLDALAAAGGISPEEAARLAGHGAPGSHLENIARGSGHKGFNQHSVSQTIRSTDPRQGIPAR